VSSSIEHCVIAAALLICFKIPQVFHATVFHAAVAPKLGVVQHSCYKKIHPVELELHRSPAVQIILVHIVVVAEPVALVLVALFARLIDVGLVR